MKPRFSLSAMKGPDDIDNNSMERQVTPPYILESLLPDSSQNNDFNLLHHVDSGTSLISNASFSPSTPGILN